MPDSTAHDPIRDAEEMARRLPLFVMDAEGYDVTAIEDEDSLGLQMYFRDGEKQFIVRIRGTMRRRITADTEQEAVIERATDFLQWACAANGYEVVEPDER